MESFLQGYGCFCFFLRIPSPDIRGGASRCRKAMRVTEPRLAGLTADVLQIFRLKSQNFQSAFIYLHIIKKVIFYSLENIYRYDFYRTWWRKNKWLSH